MTESRITVGMDGGGGWGTEKIWKQLPWDQTTRGNLESAHSDGLKKILSNSKSAAKQKKCRKYQI